MYKWVTCAQKPTDSYLLYVIKNQQMNNGTSPPSQRTPGKQHSSSSVYPLLFKGEMRSPSITLWSPNNWHRCNHLILRSLIFRPVALRWWAQNNNNNTQSLKSLTSAALHSVILQTPSIPNITITNTCNHLSLAAYFTKPTVSSWTDQWYISMKSP